MALYLPRVALIDLAGEDSIRWYKNGTQAKIQGNMGILRGGQRCKMQKQRFLSQEGVFFDRIFDSGRAKREGASSCCSVKKWGIHKLHAG